MARKKQKKKKSAEYIVLPNLELDNKAKKIITIIILLVLGVISFLGLFNLSGHFSCW